MADVKLCISLAGRSLRRRVVEVYSGACYDIFPPTVRDASKLDPIVASFLHAELPRWHLVHSIRFLKCYLDAQYISVPTSYTCIVEGLELWGLETSRGFSNVQLNSYRGAWLSCGVAGCTSCAIISQVTIPIWLAFELPHSS